MCQNFWSDSISVKVVKMNDEVVDQEKLMTAVTERFCVVWKRTDDTVWRKLRTKWIHNVLPNTISTRTVRRRLRFHEFTRRKIRKTLAIRTENRHRRVHWCRSKLRWTLNRYWKRVIFSDETHVVVDSNVTIVFMCGDALMKFGDLNVSDFVVTVHFLLCSGVVSLIKESDFFFMSWG